MQRIADLIEGTNIRLIRGRGDAVIADLTDDSRRVIPGALFIARSGAKEDGRRFIRDAIARGAIAVLHDGREPIEDRVAVVLESSDVPAATGALAARFFGEPSQELSVIGITGTNGKTTTTYIIRHLLNTAGIRCGLMGTVIVDDGAQEKAANLTTPGVIDVHRALAAMVWNGCRAVAMEVSSHALVQGRVDAVRFAGAVFTNLSGDHLDYHSSMEEYARAKSLLFQSLDKDALSVVNDDDPASAVMVGRCAARLLRCGANGRSDARAVIHEMNASTTRAEFIGPWGRFEVEVPLVGAHNVSNALHALSACSIFHLDAECLREGLSTASAPPGRLEPVTSADDGITILVDYAHSDGALENVLRALRPLVPDGGRLWTVFGCGGDRDRSKRPRMARVASEWSDLVTITSDNPRTEDPLAIIGEILQGIPAIPTAIITCQPDRRDAIRATVAEARPGDVILIAGKGHEDYQIIGTQKFPFDDRLLAREALAARRQSRPSPRPRSSVLA